MDALLVYLAAQEANRIMRSGQRPVMDRRMECNGRIIVMGEDVHCLKGGTNGATRGRRKTRHAPAPGPGLRKTPPGDPLRSRISTMSFRWATQRWCVRAGI